MYSVLCCAQSASAAAHCETALLLVHSFHSHLPPPQSAASTPMVCSARLGVMGLALALSALGNAAASIPMEHSLDGGASFVPAGVITIDVRTRLAFQKLIAGGVRSTVLKRTALGCVAEDGRRCHPRAAASRSHTRRAASAAGCQRRDVSSTLALGPQGQLSGSQHLVPRPLPASGGG